MYILLNNLIGGAITSEKEKPNNKADLKKLATLVNSLNEKFIAIHNMNNENKEIKIKYNNKCYKLILITEYEPPNVSISPDHYFKCRIAYINDKNDEIIIPWHLSIYSTDYYNNKDAIISYVHITREAKKTEPYNAKMKKNYEQLKNNTKIIVDEINNTLKSSKIYFKEYTIEGIIETLKVDLQLNRLLYSFSDDLEIKDKFNLSDDNKEILRLEEILFKEGIIHILLEFNEKINTNRSNVNTQIRRINEKYFKNITDKIKDNNDLRYKTNKNRCALKTETYNKLKINNFECYLEDEEYYNTNKNFNDLKESKEKILNENKRILDIEISDLKQEISDKQKEIFNLKIDYEENKHNKQFLNKSTDLKNTLNNLSLWSINVFNINENIDKLISNKNLLLNSKIISFIDKYTNIQSLNKKDDFLENFDSNIKKELIIDNKKLLIVNKELKKKLKNENINIKNNFDSFYFIYKKSKFKIIFISNNLIEYSYYLYKKFSNNKSVINSYNNILSKSLSSTRSKKSTILSSFKSLENKKLENIEKMFKENDNYLDRYISFYTTKYINKYKKIGKYEKIIYLKSKIDKYKSKKINIEKEYDKKMNIIVNDILNILYSKYLKLIVLFKKLIENDKKDDIRRLLVEILIRNKKNFNLKDEDYYIIIEKINDKISEVNTNLDSENNTFFKHANKLITLDPILKNTYTKNDITFFGLENKDEIKTVKQNQKKFKDAKTFYTNLIKIKDNVNLENTDELLKEISTLFIEIINNNYMININEIKENLTHKLRIYKVDIIEFKKKVNILIKQKEILENIINNEPKLNEKYYEEVNKIYELLNRNT